MTRENVQAKGRRLLTEGRVVVKTVNAQQITASVRGSGAIHQTGYDRGTWYCTCPAKGLCSHLVAVQLVTVAPVVRRLTEAAA